MTARHVPLNRDAHRELRIRSGASAELGDAVMACMTVPSEFRRVQNEFPILFRRDLETGRFAALVLFGFENGENLFLRGGRWTARYRPLALSIPPFLIGRAEGSETAQIHIDLDHPRIAGESEEGFRAFDEDGRLTPYLEEVAAGLDELDLGFRSSGDFFDALERYELLEPFSLDVSLVDGSSHRLVGYHLINEEKMRGLEAGAVAELHRDGHLMPMFMALASLSNLGRLVDLKNRRTDHG